MDNHENRNTDDIKELQLEFSEYDDIIMFKKESPCLQQYILKYYRRNHMISWIYFKIIVSG